MIKTIYRKPPSPTGFQFFWEKLSLEIKLVIFQFCALTTGKLRHSFGTVYFNLLHNVHVYWLTHCCFSVYRSTWLQSYYRLKVEGMGKTTAMCNNFSEPKTYQTTAFHSVPRNDDLKKNITNEEVCKLTYMYCSIEP